MSTHASVGSTDDARSGSKGRMTGKPWDEISANKADFSLANATEVVLFSAFRLLLIQDFWAKTEASAPPNPFAMTTSNSTFQTPPPCGMALVTSKYPPDGVHPSGPFVSKASSAGSIILTTSGDPRRSLAVLYSSFKDTAPLTTALFSKKWRMFGGRGMGPGAGAN